MTLFGKRMKKTSNAEHKTRQNHGCVPGFEADSTKDVVPGSVYGTRSFALSDDRKLTGVTYSHYTWQDGENVAHCPWQDNFGEYFSEVHSLADHSCGFWSYYGSRDPYARNFISVVPTVSGIIEGYGTTVLGEKGFRSQKAKIHALALSRTRDRIGALFWMDVVSALLNAVLMVINILAGNSLFIVNAAAFGISSMLALLTWLTHRKGKKQDQDIASRYLSGQALIEKLQEEYPSAKVYASKKEMLKDYNSQLQQRP